MYMYIINGDIYVNYFELPPNEYSRVCKWLRKSQICFRRWTLPLGCYMAKKVKPAIQCHS